MTSLLIKTKFKKDMVLEDLEKVTPCYDVKLSLEYFVYISWA